MNSPALARARTREAAPAAREELLDAVLAHDRALRVLLGGRRAPPVEAVRASWRALMHAVLRRLPGVLVCQLSGGEVARLAKLLQALREARR